MPAAAQAAEVPPSDPSLDQYIESLPVPEGGYIPSKGEEDRSAPKAIPLPPRVRQKLAGDEEGQALERFSTSPALGAPKRNRATERRRARTAAAHSASGEESTEDVKLLSALASAVGDSGGAPLQSLLAILAAMVLAGGVVATRRRRRADVRR